MFWNELEHPGVQLLHLFYFLVAETGKKHAPRVEQEHSSETNN